MNPILPKLVCAALFIASIGHAQRLFRDGPPPPVSVSIVLVGDSTVNNGGGWGPGFCALMTPNVDCLNLARNGRSSKSYYDEGLWQAALARHGNYILIQFGHNDMPGKGPERETDPETTYAANMRRYVQQTRAAGAKPVIVTSLSRRTYKDGKLVQDLAQYTNAAKRVAHEEGVPVIDLNAASTRLLGTMTQDQADKFDAETHPDAAGKGPDRTHLNPIGSAVFGRMVADTLAAVVPQLRPFIIGITLRVAADSSDEYTSVQKAIDDAPSTGGALILVAPGTYREVLTIDKPNIQLRSANPDAGKTVVVFDKSASRNGGTSHTATLNVSGNNFLAENITFKNDFKVDRDPYPEGSQAVALRVTADRALFHNVRLLGHQDTLYAASRGCTGTAEARTCRPARQYFSDCYIEGNFDFIFGDGKTVFDHCEIHSDGLTAGFITAQSKVYPQQDSGYVFYKSRLTADPGVTNVYLGRPWRPFSTVTYIDTEMGAHIQPAGWREWLPGQTHSIETATYSEFGSTGPGAHPGERDPHTRLLTADQAAQFAPDIFLRGDDNWAPTKQAIPPLP
jgi:pectin methylesterase-like acyl-CoA thioesterase/lysophospholipase L1-like esterase